jgi:hypothetical protein
MYPPVTQKSPFLHSWRIFDLPVTLFSFSIMQCPMLTCTPGFKSIHPCFQNANQIQICFVFMLAGSPETFLIFWRNFWFFYPIFILCHALFYTNLHTKFQKNPSMFPECRPNTNLLRFHASCSLCIVKFKLKISKIVNFFIFLSSIMTYPILTCIPNFERIRPCL